MLYITLVPERVPWAVEPLKFMLKTGLYNTRNLELVRKWPEVPVPGMASMGSEFVMIRDNVDGGERIDELNIRLL